MFQMQEFVFASVERCEVCRGLTLFINQQPALCSDYKHISFTTQPQLQSTKTILQLKTQTKTTCYCVCKLRSSFNCSPFPDII